MFQLYCCTYIGPTLTQLWANNDLTLGQCWVICYLHWLIVGKLPEDDKCYIVPMSAHVGPISKTTLGQHDLPSLGQCQWLRWNNVGPTKSCYMYLKYFSFESWIASYKHNYYVASATMPHVYTRTVMNIRTEFMI